MKNALRLTLALAVLLTVASVARAHDHEVTLSGKMACAHCTLKTEGVKSCQDALVVDKDGQSTLYFFAKNEVAKKFGHVCSGEKHVTVTGKVTEKDGKKWIEASKIEENKA